MTLNIISGLAVREKIQIAEIYSRFINFIVLFIVLNWSILEKNNFEFAFKKFGKTFLQISKIVI